MTFAYNENTRKIRFTDDEGNVISIKLMSEAPAILFALARAVADLGGNYTALGEEDGTEEEPETTEEDTYSEKLLGYGSYSYTYGGCEYVITFSSTDVTITRDGEEGITDVEDDTTFYFYAAAGWELITIIFSSDTEATLVFFAKIDDSDETTDYDFRIAADLVAEDDEVIVTYRNTYLYTDTDMETALDEDDTYSAYISVIKEAINSVTVSYTAAE